MSARVRATHATLTDARPPFTWHLHSLPSLLFLSLSPAAAGPYYILHHEDKLDYALTNHARLFYARLFHRLYSDVIAITNIR